MFGLHRRGVCLCRILLGHKEDYTDCYTDGVGGASLAEQALK